MNHICLIFITSAPSWVRAVVTVAEAEKIINAFREDKLPKRLGGSSQFGMWAIETSKIDAIHTVPLDEMAKQQGGVNLT